MKFDKTKKNVAVFFGGKSVEHDISIITGVQVLNNLDKNRFNVLPIYVHKSGKWLFDESFFDIQTFAKSQDFCFAKELGFCTNTNQLFVKKRHLQKKLCKLDFAFVALHGAEGENGAFSGLFEVSGLPYSASNVFASANSMNKLATKLFCEQLGIKTPRFVAIFLSDSSSQIEQKLNSVSYPVVVKPNSLGSSVGISVCNNISQIFDAISFAKLFDDVVLVEQKVQNTREFNLSILGNKNHVELSQIEEVFSHQQFFSFEEKYLGKNCGKQLGVDKKFVQNKPLCNQIEQAGKKIFDCLGLSGCVRIDFLMDSESGEVFLNEINSIPGSMANYLWSKNYSFKELLSKMFDLGIERFEQQNKFVKTFSSSVLTQFKSLGKMRK